tara:strand:- start:2149 stop:2289 length:141 start_codon:yes stop_codon:yes gene_type:complete
MIKYIFNDGTYQVNCARDGITKPHMSMDEFGLFAKEAIKKHKLNNV